MSEALKQRQADFLAAILDEDAPLPAAWGNSQAAGMAVYRGNYRGALMGALAETFERTKLYLGDKSFARVSINHAIKHPPSGWTIDEVGKGFDQSCLTHFAGNPEVAEMAWLEWAMLELATAPDCEAISAEAFSVAAAEFKDEDWGALRLSFQPHAVARLVDHNLTALWRSLGDEAAERPALSLPEPQSCLVWREGERPTFILVESDHAIAFGVMQDGGNYGEMIGALLGEDEPTPEAVQATAMRAGAILGRWLQEGIITGVNP